MHYKFVAIKMLASLGETHYILWSKKPDAEFFSHVRGKNKNYKSLFFLSDVFLHVLPIKKTTSKCQFFFLVQNNLRSSEESWTKEYSESHLIVAYQTCTLHTCGIFAQKNQACWDLQRNESLYATSRTLYCSTEL